MGSPQESKTLKIKRKKTILEIIRMVIDIAILVCVLILVIVFISTKLQGCPSIDVVQRCYSCTTQGILDAGGNYVGGLI